jgi:hypothetical protein
LIKKVELYGLTAADRELYLDTTRLLNILIKEDNITGFQRAKSADLKLGQTCTKYFMAKASGRRKKNRIKHLWHGDILLEGDDLLLAHATEFYTLLFGELERNGISLDIDFPHTLSEIENWDLTKDFEMEEIKSIVCSLAHNKSPGPDGFPGEFYQFFWDQVKFPLKKLFDAFTNGSLDIGRLNFGTITLLPKCEDSLIIQKFRPICLMNKSLKIITKRVNNRLNGVVDDLIDKTQTAFMKKRFIMEEVVVLHEILHEVKKKKMSGVLFKVDFEKAYDNVNWAFLYNIMVKKGFSHKLNDLIFSIISSRKVNIKLNDKLGAYFNTKEG